MPVEMTFLQANSKYEVLLQNKPALAQQKTDRQTDRQTNEHTFSISSEKGVFSITAQ
jgi:hypothetical protein